MKTASSATQNHDKRVFHRLRYLMINSLAHRLLVWAFALLCLVVMCHVPLSSITAVHGRTQIVDSQPPERYAVLPQQVALQSVTVPKRPVSPPTSGSLTAHLPQDTTLYVEGLGKLDSDNTSYAVRPSGTDNFRARAPPCSYLLHVQADA